MFGSIVVGTDGSETAREAVRQATELAKQVGDSIDLVSAYEPVSSSRPGRGKSTPTTTNGLARQRQAASLPAVWPAGAGWRSPPRPVREWPVERSPSALRDWGAR